jgi:hypothetical protein
MISPNLNGTSQEFLSIARDTHHPFSQFVRQKYSAMEESLRRYGLGSIISGGQTGVETAAIQCADLLGIPRFGISSCGGINENGDLPEAIAKDMFPSDRLSMPIPAELQLSKEIIAEEQTRSNWARKQIFQQHLRLNALFSSATLILPPSETLEGYSKISYDTAIRPPHTLLDVCILPLSADRLHGIGDAAWWIRQRRPLFLNIVGPAESENGVEERSIREAALSLLTQLFT